jgi:hypothetical protein
LRAEVEALISRQWQLVEPEPVPEIKKPTTFETRQTPSEPPGIKPVRIPREKPKPVPAEPPLLGKGGRQHKYLQDMVKRLAEDKGFKATIEKPVLGGKGSIDVALEKEGRLIACEISVSTTSEQELGNIQKCIAAGFEIVLVISPEKKNLTRIRQQAESSLEKGTIKNIRYLTLEEFLTFLDEEEAKAATKETTVRGYKVKVKYRPVDEAEKKTRRRVITQTIVQAMRRMKEKD